MLLSLIILCLSLRFTYCAPLGLDIDFVPSSYENIEGLFDHVQKALPSRFQLHAKQSPIDLPDGTTLSSSILQSPAEDQKTSEFEGPTLTNGNGFTKSVKLSLGYEGTFLKNFASQMASFILYGIQPPRISSDNFNVVFMKLYNVDKEIRNAFLTKISSKAKKEIKHIHI